MGFSQVAGTPKHELRNVSRVFNPTLGYPGEGPPRSRVAPVTPPGPKTPPKSPPRKVSGPKTPPKSKPSSPESSPPWNRDLEDEVRGLSRAYLERQPRETSSTWTESRRVLGAPKASAARPRPPPPPPSRRSDVRTAGLSASITAPSLGPLPPPQVLSFKTGTKPGSLASGGSTLNVVEKRPPPPPPQRRGPSMETGRVVKARFPTGFDYETAQAKAKECPDGYRQTKGLPIVRPGLPFNPSSRLNLDVPRVGPKEPQGSGEQPDVVREQAAEPSPEVGTPEVGMQGQPQSSKILLSRQGSEQGNPKGPQSLGLRPEPADPKIRQSSHPSPEPASEAVA